MSNEPLFERLMREWDETTSALKEIKNKGKLSALEADWLRTRLIQLYDMLLELKTGVHPPEYFASRQAEPVPAREKQPSSVSEKNEFLRNPQPAPVSGVHQEATGTETPPSQSKTMPVSDAPKSKQKPEILADKFTGTRKFMHDQLAETIKTEKKDLSSVMKSRPIRNIESAIGLNEKFLFIKELFAGNAHQYKETIDTLNNASGLEEAMDYLHKNFTWDESDPVVMQLLELVQRRHSRQS